MSAYKDQERGTWYCQFRYTDYQGKTHRTTKRGFRTKKDAVKYEQDFRARAGKSGCLTMGALCDAYLEDKHINAKTSTYIAVKKIINRHIRPAFSNLAVSEIRKADIRDWKNMLLQSKTDSGKAYSPNTLHTITAQLSALFNYAVKYYDLPSNPVRAVGTIGKRTSRQAFWTEQQFRQFIGAIDDYPLVKLAFNLLFYSGMRAGELIALTASHFDFSKGTISISKTAARGTNTITSPKTSYSIREIAMPPALMEDVQYYISHLLEPPERVLDMTWMKLEWNMKKYAQKAGLEPIHVHDLRHSHASYLIHHGVPITTISRRLGHANANITLSVYSHMYVESENDVAQILNETYKKE